MGAVEGKAMALRELEEYAQRMELYAAEARAWIEKMRADGVDAHAIFMNASSEYSPFSKQPTVNWGRLARYADAGRE